MGKKKHSHYLSSICLAETWIPFFFSSTLVMTFSRIILWFCRASSRCLNLWKKGKFSGHVFPRSWVNRWEQGRFLWGQWACVKSLVSQTTELSLLWLLNSDQPAASAGKDGWEVLNPAELQQQKVPVLSVLCQEAAAAGEGVAGLTKHLQRLLGVHQTQRELPCFIFSCWGMQSKGVIDKQESSEKE